MGNRTRWPMGHMEGPTIEGWPPSRKKKGNGPKERKGKEEGPMGQPGRNQQQALES